MDLHELDVNVDKIADEIMDDGMLTDFCGDPSKSLLPPQLQMQRLKLQLLPSLTNHFLRIATGINTLLTHLQNMSRVDETIIAKNLLDKILSKLLDKNELGDEELTALYCGAIQIYNAKEYEKAADAFYVLKELDPGQGLFWKALGHARFHAHQFLDAVDAYSGALKIDSKDIESLIFQALSLENIGRSQEAIDTLYLAKENILQDPQGAMWQDTLTALIHKFKK